MGECFTQCYSQRLGECYPECYPECLGEPYPQCYPQCFTQSLGECFPECYPECSTQCLGECITQCFTQRFTQLWGVEANPTQDALPRWKGRGFQLCCYNVCNNGSDRTSCSREQTWGGQIPGRGPVQTGGHEPTASLDCG